MTQCFVPSRDPVTVNFLSFSMRVRRYLLLNSQATAAGYDAILAYGWYLDRQTPVDHQVSWFWQDTWAQMYAVDPEPEVEPEGSGERGGGQQGLSQGRVLGGEASLWSEQVRSSRDACFKPVCLQGLRPLFLAVPMCPCGFPRAQVDPANALSQAWPRAAAAAERLWSARASTPDASADLADASRRLAALRCRLVAWHAVPAAPLWSDWCSASYPPQ